MELPYVRLVVAASVALLMARSGLKKKSLSKDGAAAAVTVGFISSTHATTAAAPTLAPGSDTSASLQPRGRFFFCTPAAQRTAPPRCRRR
jgi:hypothetical protein